MRYIAVFLLLVIALGLGYYLAQPTAPMHAPSVAAALPAGPQTGSPGPAPAEPDDQGGPSLEHFKQLLEGGRYDAAAALYELAEHESPELFAAFEGAYRDQLKADMKAENYGAVVALTEAFRAYWYNDFRTLVYLAAACSHLGDFRCTIDAYYSAILYGVDSNQGDVARKNLDLFLRKTDELWGAGQRWQDLITLYEHALGWEPDNAAYYLRLAEIYLELGDYGAAEYQLASILPGAANAQRLARIRNAIAGQNTVESGVPLARKGSHYLVDVRLNGVPTRLMIDTGASVSALSRQAAAQLVDSAGLLLQGETQLATAGGRISSPVYLADTVSIDRHDLYGVEWVVIDYPDTDVDGVLGMNVLSQFEFKLDQQRSILLLRPR